MSASPSARHIRSVHAQYAAAAAREAPAPEGISERQRLLYWALAVGVAAVWGVVPISSKYLIETGFGAWTLLVLRVVIAYGVMVLIAPMKLFVGIRSEAIAVILGVVLVPVGWGLQNLALVNGTVSDVAISASAAPIFAGLIASALLRTRLHWLLKLGAVASASGMLLTAFDTGIMSDLSLEPIVWGLVAAVGLALYSLILRAAGDVPASLMMRKILGWGLVFSLPFYFYESADFSTEGKLLFRPDVLANLAFLAVAAAGAFFWQRLALKIGAQAVGSIAYLSPVIAVAASIAIFDDPISYVGIMGGTMVLCGAVCAHTGLLRVAVETARRL